jgi:PAS domain S-box-containing protein
MWGGGKMKNKVESMSAGRSVSDKINDDLKLKNLVADIERLSDLLQETEQELVVSNAELRLQVAERLKQSGELLQINKQLIAQTEIDLKRTIELKATRETLELQQDKIRYVTVLKAKNLAIKIKELKFHELLENIGFAILIHHRGVITYVNNYALEVFHGLQVNDLKGNLISSLFHGDDKQALQQQFNQVATATLVTNTIDVRCVRLSGEIFDVEVMNSFTIYKNKPAIITRLVETADRKLRWLADKSEEVNKLIAARDKFFAIIAHDLRGPLGGFMALTEILADSTYELPEDEKKKMIFEMSLAARNTFELLESLLEWAKMDLNQGEFNPSFINVQSLCVSAFTILEECVKAKSLEFKIDIPADIKVYADQNMLQSIFRNLISNAIKFTPEYGKVSVYCKSINHNKIEILIEDTGIGMSDQLRDNLFILTSRSRRLGTNGEKSTGLGLHLCKQFIEKHGGEFKVKSIENQGSIFSFTLPRIPSALKQ